MIPILHSSFTHVLEVLLPVPKVKLIDICVAPRQLSSHFDIAGGNSPAQPSIPRTKLAAPFLILSQHLPTTRLIALKLLLVACPEVLLELGDMPRSGSQQVRCALTS